MDLGIKNKWALVTGAGRGLGEGICRSLSKEGVCIVATSRTARDLETLIDSLGGAAAGHRFLSLDIAAADGPAQLVEYVREQGIEPDIVVNNVGGNLGFTDPLGPVDEWQQVMRLNVEVALEINRAFIPVMREKKWGRIIHFSSIRVAPGTLSYTTTKHGLLGMSKVLAKEYARFNITSNALILGAFDTGMFQNLKEKVRKDMVSQIPSRKLGDVKNIVNAITFIIDSPFVNGTSITIDGGASI